MAMNTGAVESPPQTPGVSETCIMSKLVAGFFRTECCILDPNYEMRAHLR
jgi:hypothetical protein